MHPSVNVRSPWGVVTKGGTDFRTEGALEKRQMVLRALNKFFRKIDDRKRAREQEKAVTKKEGRGSAEGRPDVGKACHNGGFKSTSNGDAQQVEETATGATTSSSRRGTRSRARYGPPRGCISHAKQ